MECWTVVKISLLKREGKAESDITLNDNGALACHECFYIEEVSKFGGIYTESYRLQVAIITCLRSTKMLLWYGQTMIQRQQQAFERQQKVTLCFYPT